MDLEGAYKVYVKAKSISIYPSNSVYSCLLSLLAGFGDQGSGSGPPREVEPPSDLLTAEQVFADMRTRGVPQPESTFTAMIRCFCLHDRRSEALSLFEEMKQRDLLPKLRTFFQLLKVHSSDYVSTRISRFPSILGLCGSRRCRHMFLPVCGSATSTTHSIGARVLLSPARHRSAPRLALLLRTRRHARRRLRALLLDLDRSAPVVRWSPLDRDGV